MESKFVYMFSEGNLSMRNTLGGKGATLADMTQLGFPIPQGFIVSTEACNQYYNEGNKLSFVMEQEIEAGMKNLEQIAGKKFGDINDPLLVSVRSGARVSMPGMMDTVLNLGLNDTTVLGIAKSSGNTKFAFDSYRRFIQMYSDVVMGIDRDLFETIIQDKKTQNGITLDSDLSEDDLKDITEQFKAVYASKIGQPFPQDPKIQLLESIKAVFRSWMNPRAETYRRMNSYSSTWGTAVNVQIMVFGNMGDTSGSGVAFSRSPIDGNPELFGEYLMDAQGEDVVSGIRTPSPIQKLHDMMPSVYHEFLSIAKALESHYKDMQDIEFTIEKGTLYILQARSGKRTAQAAIKIAVDLVHEGVITKEQALLQVKAAQVNQVLHPQFDKTALDNAHLIGKGLAASPGAASGAVYFSSNEAQEAHAKGIKVILVRHETSPEDIEGMSIAQGILTAHGGMTSHAAVVARGMGTSCISGCTELRLLQNKQFELGGVIVSEGEIISLDGSTGMIYQGSIATSEAQISGDFKTLMDWADELGEIKVYANADSPTDAKHALEFGAQGIGLCRTEHMFFSADRIMRMRQMIVAQNDEQRRTALDYLLPMQRQDFIDMFSLMGEHPMTIRLLDPPLHEFLPQDDDAIQKLATSLEMSFESLKGAIKALQELNPMMGHRGVRLAVTYPQIAQMQTRAIIEAAISVKQTHGVDVRPEIMVPLISDVKELEYIYDLIVNEADMIIQESGIGLKYKVGTMIEIPRAIVLADQLAKISDFFSFGTNDLTQLTYGLSRDDAGAFLDDYYNKGLFKTDPFSTIDQEGVGALVKMAVTKAREAKPDMKIGICGEHGGDAESVIFFAKLGLDYVSCSSYRIPIAKLASAQAALLMKAKG